MNKILQILFFFFICSTISFSQILKKKMEDLDSAYYHDDYIKSKKLIAEILPKAESVKDDTVYIEFLSTCGSVYYHTNEFTTAENYFLLASEKAKIVFGENDYHYSLPLFNLAGCYKEEGRYAEAEPLYMKSLPVLAEAFGQYSVEYTRCFYTLGSMYVDMAKYDYAESMCVAAVNFYKEKLGTADPEYLGALGTVGIIYQGQGKYDKAEEIVLALLNYFKSLPNQEKETIETLQNNLGDLYRTMGEYERAEPILLEVIKTCDEHSLSAATILNNLGLVQKALGKFSESESSYKKSISIYKFLNKTNHPDYASPVNNLGELYRGMGRLQEAFNSFVEVLEVRRKMGGTEHPNYANALNNLALVEYKVGNLVDAEQHFLAAKEIYRKVLGEKHRFYANSLNSLASIYKEQGDLKKAEATYLECIKIYKENYGETNDTYGTYLGQLALIYHRMKRYDEAINLTKKSLEIIKNKLGENHFNFIEAEYNLAEICLDAGKYKEAEIYYLKAIQGYMFLIEKYFPSLSEKGKTEFYYTIYYSFETYNSFVIQMMDQFPKDDHHILIEQMFNNQLVYKSLLLKETGKTKIKVAASNNEELKKEYEQLIKMRENIVQQYRLSVEDIAEIGIDLPALEKEANDLEQKINSTSSLIITKSDSEKKSWKEIQKVLKSGECAVEMVQTQFYINQKWTDSIYYSAIIIDKICLTPKFVLLKNGNELENNSIKKYRTLIKSKSDDEFAYTIFWKPLKAAIGNSNKIYFSPDGVYQQVNLYTLKNPETKKYLIEETTISLLTNTNYLLETHVSSTSKKAEIFSYPDYDFTASSSEVKSIEPLSRYGFAHLQELPGTKIEADAITKILETQNWKVNKHLQAEASEDAIKKIVNPKVLHIATHGFFLEDVNENESNVIGIQAEKARENPLLRSGLMLAGAASIARDSILDNTKEDGILTAYEAANLDLTQTDLVVLSACETGLGEVHNGQGVYGLQRAFMVAGAKAVIMSLWVVDDYATQELMSIFYSEWLKDPTSENKQRALRTAQLKLKEKYPEPYFWGAFVMVGE
ncbi:MAG: hypothetical protein A3F72_18010 [Bacteroidetes bacterium RIFCSPLOWO2_12_FULL_35_15]|nr:MAG: hypothetical protein A3F72_18010 [Bacteroidetes bacterium RIFCSPLOWO2_12_FULL_35_15]